MRARRLVTMARYGLGVMRTPVPAVEAALLQCARLDVPAVRGLGDDARVRHPRAAARRGARAGADERGDALSALARATSVSCRPRSRCRSSRTVCPYPKGFAFGIGLQAIEMSVGVGIGLLFLAREGLSFAMLKRMPGAEQAEVAQAGEAEADTAEEPARARARISG